MRETVMTRSATIFLLEGAPRALGPRRVNLGTSLRMRLPAHVSSGGSLASVRGTSAIGLTLTIPSIVSCSQVRIGATLSAVATTPERASVSEKDALCSTSDPARPGWLENARRVRSVSVRTLNPSPRRPRNLMGGGVGSEVDLAARVSPLGVPPPPRVPAVGAAVPLVEGGATLPKENRLEEGRLNPSGGAAPLVRRRSPPPLLPASLTRPRARSASLLLTKAEGQRSQRWHALLALPASGLTDSGGSRFPTRGNLSRSSSIRSPGLFLDLDRVGRPSLSPLPTATTEPRASTSPMSILIGATTLVECGSSTVKGLDGRVPTSRAGSAPTQTSACRGPPFLWADALRVLAGLGHIRLFDRGS